jgi:AcrR family transcriptional regulator
MSNEISPRERLVTAADQLFMERGYKSVTLRDIADAVGIKHASIYHHVPGGKKQLFIEVVERTFKTHHDGITTLLRAHDGALRPALVAVAGWLLAHPPMDLMRMTMSDMSELEPAESARLGMQAMEMLVHPLRDTINAAIARGEIDPVDAGVVAPTLLSSIEALHAVPDHVFAHTPGEWRGRTRLEMAECVIDILLKGLLPRAAATTPST